MVRELTREEQEKLDYVNSFQSYVAGETYANAAGLASLIALAASHGNPIAWGFAAGSFIAGMYCNVRMQRKARDSDALDAAIDCVHNLEGKGVVRETFHNTFSLRKNAAQAA